MPAMPCCRLLPPLIAAAVLSGVEGDTDPNCGQWASKGECDKNPAFMRSGCADACARWDEMRRDKDPNCEEWAARGDCDTNKPFMRRTCVTACEKVLRDRLPPNECAAVNNSGGCHTADGLAHCRTTCYEALKRNLTPDTEGNCWYWGTDGECVGNDVWMKQTCPRSCGKLWACRDRPHSRECAAPFECPPAPDEAGDCIERARRGECRPASAWEGVPLLRACSLSCHLLDPPSVSHTVTRPRVQTSRYVDAGAILTPQHRHATLRCPYGKEGYTDFGKQFFFSRRALLSGQCPNTRVGQEWRLAAGRCPPRLQEKTPRLPHPPPLGEEAADAVRSRAPLTGRDKWDPAKVRVQTVYDSPRVRLVHNFVTPEEAEELIQLSASHYHRSSTARAGSDDYRTSESSSLPPSNPAVNAVRQRIAFYVGYPEAALEPLQGLRYQPGQYYKPHHDYYNACETWLDGNRHFTFLIYLNHVEEGGETAFPALNLTVPTTAYAALLFNDCLDNGEPDERTQHEGKTPISGNKYAINGWMRSKYLGRTARF